MSTVLLDYPELLDTPNKSMGLSRKADEQVIAHEEKSILYIGYNAKAFCQGMVTLGFGGVSMPTFKKAITWLKDSASKGMDLPHAIICDYALPFDNIEGGIAFLRSNDATKEIPIILITSEYKDEEKEKAISLGVNDYYDINLDTNDLKDRISLLLRLNSWKKTNPTAKKEPELDIPELKMYSMKRFLDISASFVALLLLSPLFLLIAIILKLESKGPVFYVSKRAGSNYKIINFYKFRSMRQGADKEVNKLLHLNQYTDGIDVKDEKGGNPAFFKIKNDPRVTTFGKFLRKSSLDELPQLINVFLGDMSLVGNRPLPLYEAELLTKDQYALRFLAPAGITGLWQVTKRGREEMSEEERMQLDMDYARHNSFLFDLKIILKTIPALIQKEEV